MFASNTSQVGGSSTDPQFNYVTMLLHGDGTNGAQNNTFIDSSTNNFTITRNGNTTQGSFSPYGTLWSNYFPGSSYLTSATSSNFALTGDFTIEWWVNTNNSNTYVAPLFVQNSSFSQRIGFFADSGYWTYTVYPDINDTLIQPVEIGKWVHLAMTRSGTTVRVFINGTLAATNTASSSFSTDRVVVGYVQSTGTYLTGYASNVRVVKGTALYTSSFTPSTTPLTAVSGTSLLTCQSNRFIDNSSNNFTLTVTGTPSVQRFSPFAPSSAYSTATIGGSGYFDGDADYLSVPSSSAFAFGTGDFTVEAWVYPLDTYVDAIIKPNTNNLNPYINGGGYPSVYLGSGFTTLTGSKAATNFAWNHIAVTRSSGTMRIFLNGENIGSTTSTPSYGTISLTVGSSGTFFKAYLSDLRIVSTALYTSNFTVPTTPITAVSNTQLLLSMINGAIFDNAMQNDLETVGNAQISTSVKKYGTGSMAFDGSGDYLVGQNTPNISLPGDFTIEAWFYQTNAAQNSPQICIGDAANSGTCLLYIDTNQKLACYLNGFNNVGSSTASINTWHHVAVVRSGSTITTYLNGVSQSTVTTSTTLSGVPYFGAGLFSGTFYYGAGYIDDLRITKGYARYTANFTPPTQAFPNN